MPETFRDEDLTDDEIHAAFGELRQSILADLRPRGAATARRALRRRRQVAMVVTAASLVGLTVGAAAIVGAKAPVPAIQQSGEATPQPTDSPLRKDMPNNAWVVGAAASADMPFKMATAVERAGTYRFGVTCRGTGTGELRLDVSPGTYTKPDGTDAAGKVACGVPPITSTVDLKVPAGKQTVNVYVAWDAGTVMRNDVNGDAWLITNDIIDE
ncbi:hypothetical protein DFJ67_7845 [Asanoa ferruginea]|uniref:Uncharacterized protein n=1 Tax=Asanoa ferruginea TaxID=53367 RepID=A0A3D9ZX38_9ACTN|nr:hypothetical protein [Asanoa ferruginea]REG01758.1 hypothetical protein DFJ67_7845 [Asanoa ferruginea]GIF49209.1 hypothetical protein Afe04nite_37480 [Asanoa ferruginea]